MSLTPHIDAASPDFPVDPSPQPLFRVQDSVRSLLLWSIGIPHLAAWTTTARFLSHLGNQGAVERALTLMSRALPALMGIKIAIRGADALDPGGTYLYISNHVNIFDTFAIYQAIPHDARGLEHIDHFSWPIIGPFLKSVGQIPVDPHDHRSTAKGLRQATKMLKQGKSIVVLPEGSRTLDGTVGHFFPGAFRLAISASVPVVPIAIRGGRAVSRRGEWRIRPGREELLVGAPVPTVGMRQKDAAELSKTCRSIIIDLLQGRRAPGH